VRFEGSGKILRVGAESRKWSVRRVIRNQCHLVCIFPAPAPNTVRSFAGARQIKRPAGQNVGWSSQKFLDQGSFFQKFGHSGINLVTAEIVQPHVWHHFPAGAGGADRE
jgi:hypothetical protein